MADKEVTGLTAATVPLDGTEDIHIVQGGNSRQVEQADLGRLPIKTEAGTSYPTVAADNGKWVRMTNGSAITVTISDATHTAGDEITFEQAGAGTITFAAGGSLNLRTRGSLLDTNGQYAVASVKFISAGEAILFGDLV